MTKPVRMADIAEKLDISVVSVSKALAGKPGVSEEMRAKVVALAKQMGYEGTKGSGEPTGTGNIGVLVADRFFAGNVFYTGLYRSLVLKCGDVGFTCMMEIVTPEAERGCELPALLTSRKVDGIIFMGNLDPAYLRKIEAAGLPCLKLDFHLPGCASGCVVSDNLEGACTLTQHLLSAGRRNIGFAGSICATSSIMDRYLGYQKALRLAGITPREDWRIEDRDQDGRFISLQLPDPLPDAFICSCDEVAYNLVDALGQTGKRVPEDVAVCGYDDFRFATLCKPPLTTYRVNVDEMASAAVGWMSRQIRPAGPVPPLMLTVPGQLVVRESSGLVG